MMRTRQPGFTLVELLVVMVIAAVIMGAMVQSLVIQERTYRATGEKIRGQDGLRIALGVLEAELRDAATDTDTHGAALGGRDIAVAASDSVVIRAHRKLGFVCSTPTGSIVRTWSISQQDRFGAEDVNFLIFWDGNPNTGVDDGWLVGAVTEEPATSSGPCPGKPGSAQVADNRLTTDIDAGLLAGVWPGAPVRSFQNITYGLYPVDDDWALRRREGNGELQTVVPGLATRGEGLVFTYFDSNGNTLTGDPITNPAQIASIQITARTDPNPGTGASPVELTTTIFLRNN